MLFLLQGYSFDRGGFRDGGSQHQTTVLSQAEWVDSKAPRISPRYLRRPDQPMETGELKPSLFFQKKLCAVLQKDAITLCFLEQRHEQVGMPSSSLDTDEEMLHRFHRALQKSNTLDERTVSYIEERHGFTIYATRNG